MRAGSSEELTEPTLAIVNLHVDVGGASILNGVNLAMHGPVTVMIGRNGMGKTTLCQALMGLRRPSQGKIIFCGHDITHRAPYSIARLGIAYVPQGRRLFPSLSVAEHVKISKKAGQRSTEIWTTERIYEFFPNLWGARDRKAGQLSGGEQQMLAISRALLTQPRLIILDEPSEGLAPVIVDEVVELLVKLSSEDGQSLLVVEQNLLVAAALGSELQVMSNGVISGAVAAAEMLSDRELQQRHLGVN